MAQQTWYADGRVLRTKSEMTRGIKNPFLNNANLVDLNDMIYQIVYGIIPGTPTGAINASNGLTGTVTPTSYDITLGGNLTTNTTISGGGTLDLSFSDINSLVARATDIILQPSGGLYFESPGLGAAFNGYVWTLTDVGTGEGEWTALPSETVTAANNGLNIDTNTVQLGGNLVENTSISGDAFSYNLTITDLSNLDLASNSTSIKGINSMYITPPNTLSADDETHILTLLDNSTGECQYRPNNVRPLQVENTANPTITTDAYTVLLDAATAGGAMTVEIPIPTSAPNRILVFKLISAGTATIASLSPANPIFTDSAQPSISLTTVGETVTLHADSSSNLWYVIS